MFERILEEAGQDPALFSSENLPKGGKHPLGELTVITSPHHDPTQYPQDEEDADEDDEDLPPLPWVVSIDGFLTNEECDRLIELGESKGYDQSTKYDDEELGKHVVDESRTSSNTWCQGWCDSDPIVRGVIDRMTKLTGIPYDNYEPLQLVHYKEGQKYNKHHDLTVVHDKMPFGPRILTIFLYLNDVEDGSGGTNFPYLNFTAIPKKGNALIWPSVSDDLKGLDDWTWHAALPVDEGSVKYGANAWVHLRDYQNADISDC